MRQKIANSVFSWLKFVNSFAPDIFYTGDIKVLNKFLDFFLAYSTGTFYALISCHILYFLLCFKIKTQICVYLVLSHAVNTLKEFA